MQTHLTERYVSYSYSMVNSMSSRPLRATEADAALYLHRPVHDTLLRAIRQGSNVLLVGERGSGKTTVTNMVARDLAADVGLDVRRVSVATVSTADELLIRVSRGILDQTPLGDTNNLLPAIFIKPASFEAKVRSVIRQLEREADEQDGNNLRRMVVILDDAPPAAAWQLFGGHRDLMWELSVQWVVTGWVADRAELRRPPADAFFDVTLDLDELDRDDLSQLLKARLGSIPENLEPSQILNLIESSGGNPRKLLQLASHVTAESPANAARLSAALMERDRKIHSLGRAASMLAAELQNLGPMSASDPKLLARLGWTRPRAAQVFKELSEAGLLKSEELRGETGRPRKMYRLIKQTEMDIPGQVSSS